eukprot:TRINITY_DN8614_c0_g1_i1.p1 TRINITY_DN8614_c0_g1~~TRINITY_DN8614_c0_g1_i1.p1  ORF type:complete len:219 (+),score=23.61 TRINITY_DN8614_c0_g1_i1:39-695(+)
MGENYVVDTDWSSFIKEFNKNTPQVKKQIQKKDLVVTDTKKHAFQLFNVLTPEECEFFIRDSERLGYKHTSYPKDYRSNTRVMVEHPGFAKELWERVQEFIPSKFYNRRGEWQASGLNERFRFCRYYPGEFFQSHRDGAFERSYNERSFLTFMLYLNGGFSGGTTNFLEKKLYSEVVPVAGMVLVFEHDIVHEGDSLKSGIKYLLRSDVVYTYLRPVE